MKRTGIRKTTAAVTGTLFSAWALFRAWVLFPAWILFLAWALAVRVGAESPAAGFADRAGVVSPEEERSLSAFLDEVSARHGVDVAAVIVDSLGGQEAGEAADRYYENGGFGTGEERSGMLLLLAVGEGQWHISTEGKPVTGFGEKEVRSAGLAMSGFLSAGDYAGAVRAYAEEADRAFREHGADGSGRGPFPIGRSAAAAAAAGLIVSLFYGGRLKGQLKSVSSKSAASEYAAAGSLKLTRSSESFLYRKQSREAKAQPQRSGGGAPEGTHAFSSGRTHGGGGGSF
ncbi:TPM domain-containing protein [Lachnoclostridium sp. Marseille-P6806]|uniref:TPM domain-containing protein n=1 Tax=Lachnoclostridium sp. Marseille-P6806 TaxID=2364793 RepID=UPI001032407D|nr:TPM domain-containing protein [Lachnoclostridium sp. Marseille-P6806]